MRGGEDAGGRGLGLAIRDTLQLGVTELALDQRAQTHVVFADYAVGHPVTYLLAPFDGDCADPCGDRESDGDGLARRHCASTMRWAPTPWAAGPITATCSTTWKHVSRSGGVMSARRERASTLPRRSVLLVARLLAAAAQTAPPPASHASADMGGMDMATMHGMPMSAVPASRAVPAAAAPARKKPLTHLLKIKGAKPWAYTRKAR